MAYGEDFNAVAADRRAIDGQSAANYFNAINAEARQRDADAANRARDINTALQVRQMNDQGVNRRYDRDEMNRRAGLEDARFERAYRDQRGDVGARRSAEAQYFDYEKQQDRADRVADLADFTAEVDNTGAALAMDFGETARGLAEADRAVKELRAEQATLANAGARIGYEFNPTLGMLKKGAAGTTRDPSEGGLERINPRLVDINLRLKDATADLVARQRAYAQTLATARKSGFMPDLRSNRLTHAQTGKAFDFGSVTNAPGAGYFEAQNTEVVPVRGGVDVSTQAVVAPNPYFGAPTNRVAPVPMPQPMANQFTDGVSVGRGAPEPMPAVAQPQSMREFAALPPGTLYLNPADGQVYRKK